MSKISFLSTEIELRSRAAAELAYQAREFKLWEAFDAFDAFADVDNYEYDDIPF